MLRAMRGHLRSPRVLRGLFFLIIVTSSISSFAIYAYTTPGREDGLGGEYIVNLPDTDNRPYLDSWTAAPPPPPPLKLTEATEPWAKPGAPTPLAVPKAAVKSGVCPVDANITVPAFAYDGAERGVPEQVGYCAGRDEQFLDKRGCVDGLRFLRSFRRMQHSATCTTALFYAGDRHAEPVIEICLDVDKLRPPCTVFSVGIGYNFVFDDLMHARGCVVHSFDPTMAMEETVRHEAPLSVFHPVGLAAYDGLLGGVDFEYNHARQRPPPYEVRTLPTLMRQHNASVLNLLRVDAEGAEWDVLNHWIGSNVWEHVRQLSMELHQELGFLQLPETTAHLRLRNDVLNGIPFSPVFTTRNVMSGGPLLRSDCSPSIGRATEVSFIPKPYKPRHPASPAFWRRWGFEHTDSIEVPEFPYTYDAGDTPYDFESIRTVLATIKRDHCAQGLSVTAGTAPARVCTAGLRGDDPCVMYVFTADTRSRASDALDGGGLTGVNQLLADALVDELRCKVRHFYVVDDGDNDLHPRDAAGKKARKKQAKGEASVVSIAQLTAPGGIARLTGVVGDEQVHAVRLDVGYLTPQVLLGWARRRGTYSSIPQLSIRFPVDDDLANVWGLARAFMAWPQPKRPLPYWSAMGADDAVQYDPERPGVTYEISYVLDDFWEWDVSF